MNWRIARQVIIIVLVALVTAITTWFVRIGPFPVSNPVIATVSSPQVKTVYVPKSNVIEVKFDKRLKGWPIEKAIQQWNENYSLLFTTDNPKDSLATIRLVAYESQRQLQNHCQSSVGEETWGCWAPDKETIALWTSVPKSKRMVVLCHELGHALGLDHDDTGCMQQGTSYPKPSEADLDKVYANYWML